MSTLLARSVHIQNPIPIEGYTIFSCGNTAYAIWEDGNVWNITQGKYLKPDIDKDGYFILSIGNKKTKLHRLMLFIYKGAPTHGQQARHLDGNPANNSRLNLTWGTATENWLDRINHGRGTGRAKAPWNSFPENHHKRIGNEQSNSNTDA